MASLIFCRSEILILVPSAVLFFIVFLSLSSVPRSSASRVDNGTPSSSSSFINSISQMFDFDDLDDVITTYMRERKIPGASIAVSKGGQFLMRKGYGRASAQRLMTPWALMRIGSVSKIVTAISVLRLYDKGRLGLDAHVFGNTGLLAEYVNVTSSSGSRSYNRLLNITVRHLLEHSAGWDHRIIGDPLFQRELPTTSSFSSSSSSSSSSLFERGRLDKESIIRFMVNQTLQYNPGTRYSYSNFGYMLLGVIVERLTGLSYESYTRDLLQLLGIYRMKIGKTLKEEADISEVTMS